MGHGCRVRYQAFNAAQRLGQRKQLQCIQENPHLLFTGVDFEADHRAETFLLPACQFVPGVTGQPRITGFGNEFALLQELRNSAGVLLMLPVTHTERAQAAQGLEAIESSSTSDSSLARTAPPTISECPLMYLVVECKTTSAPSLNGC